MKANELMIGNWVSKHGEIYQITSATIVCLERGESDVNPIPITPEWLERVGFVSKPNNLFILGKIELRYYRGRSDVLVRGINVSYKYVHQLQNLYFALTGEELELKR